MHTVTCDVLCCCAVQVSNAEYLLLLATFLSILQFELEKGVAAGILLCTLYFAVTYARVNTRTYLNGCDWMLLLISLA